MPCAVFASDTDLCKHVVSACMTDSLSATYIQDVLFVRFVILTVTGIEGGRVAIDV